jgi:hypothetical protein
MRVTVQELATAMDCAEGTVRTMIRAGDLTSVKEDCARSARGYRYLVDIEQQQIDKLKDEIADRRRSPNGNRRMLTTSAFPTMSAKILSRDFWSAVDLSELLKLHPSTISKLIQNKKLKTYSSGQKTKLIRQEDALAILNERKKTSREPAPRSTRETSVASVHSIGDRVKLDEINAKLDTLQTEVLFMLKEMATLRKQWE